MASAFPRLFSPLQVGSYTLKNRLVCLPHGTGFTDGGRPTEQQARYLEQRAKGGVGMIIFSSNSVHPREGGRGRFHAFDERFIPDFKMLVDTVHAYDTPIVCQLVDGGASTSSFDNGLPRWAFSPIPCPVVRETPHEMDLDQVEDMVAHFTRSARNMDAAGFDGIEIHAAHGYLIQESISPKTNIRTDRYGGSFENRLRFLFEIIDQVRAAITPGKIVGVRISGDEMTPGGLTLDDMSDVARRIEATGKVDYLSVTFGTARRYVLDMSAPPATIAHMAKRIKAEVTIPVIASQRINEPALAERLLEEGQADLIGMARALIADPQFPIKAREGRIDDIRPCVACLQECRRTTKGGTISCIHNPAVGREAELAEIARAPNPQKVMIVGGGPAGLEAARVAALRGHKVTLWEKSDLLGGQVNLAALASSRAEIGGVVKYLVTQIGKLGVDVRLGREVTVASVEEEAPDAVVVATGSVPQLPALPGADAIKVVSVWDALRDSASLGENIVVVDGGEGFWPCCATAEFLAENGKRVSIVSRLSAIGLEVPIESFPGLHQRLARLGIAQYAASVASHVNGKDFVGVGVFSGVQTVIPDVDAVVMATNNAVRDDLYRAWKGKVGKLVEIGDCVAPRKIADAIREGHLAARAI